MTPPDKIRQHYPVDAWLDDFDYWVSRGPLRSPNVPQVLAYFQKKYPDNPERSAMAAYFWNANQFLEGLLPALAEAGLVNREPDDGFSIPTAFQSALYRATLSFPEEKWRHRIDVPLLAKLTKDQKDWNEDRS